MEMLRWIAAVVAALLFLFFAIGNWVLAWQARRTGRGYSMIPLMGAGAWLAACAVCPAVELTWWTAAPALLDVTVWNAAILPFYLVWWFCTEVFGARG